jgi:S-DNA-T family DNA segregation ATPase FtsK/SpoIIIE
MTVCRGCRTAHWYRDDVSTWGPSKRKSRRSSGSQTSRPRTTQTPTRNTASRPPAAPAAQGGRRAQATAELREAVAGREHEYIGVGLIAGGILLALAIYLNVAGPLGRGVETLFGWLTGIARFLVPAALVAVGVALVGRGKSVSPMRLVIGWAMIAVSVLGLLHVVNGPNGLSDLDEVDDGGGIVGAAIAEPLQALLATPGALVVFIVVAVGGVLIITRTSLRTMAQRTGRGVGAVAVPLGRAARQALRDLSSLSSDKDGDDDATTVLDAGPDLPGLPPPPYDAAADFDEPPGGPARRSRSTRGNGAGPGAAPPGPSKWTLPPVALLHRTGALTIDKREIEARGRVLQESLAQHGVETSLVGMTVGPTVTRYELELGAGVKVARVTTLQRDIAYAMAATDVRILAPIPGRSAIGVEVPNQARQLVALGDLLVSKEAAAATHPLDVALGKDIAGKAVFLELATTPHLLIAGATGAGKSSALNCIITSMLMRSTPDQVRLILVDPKQVEMGQYNRLPHLLTQPVTNPKKAANALGWAVKEMERRYDLLYEYGFRDISGYNAAFDRGELAGETATAGRALERLPFIVVVVDELNDLMMVAARDVEDSITRIAQKARAVGIHLIVATQRPSVNVITGVIKANIPARIAFAVSSLTDSRVILDQPGAEKLVGRGDMLLLPGNSSVAQRVQGAFVAEEEVRKVVAHWRRQAPEVTYVSGVEGDDEDSVTSSANAFSAGGDDDDAAMLRQAMELVVRSQLGSTSMLQRKLKVGFARAGRLMDLLEQRGVVGPSEGSKARAVLMTVEEFELLQQAEREQS